MKSIVIAQQKGGVGKTALSLHLAWFLTEIKGKKVLFLDLDTQGNATYTLSLGEYPTPTTVGSGDLFLGDVNVDMKSIKNDFLVLSPATNNLADVQNLNLVDAASRFLNNINKMKQLNYFDYCIIDTPPSLSNTLVSALLASDYAICPIELELYSIQGIQKMVSTILNVKKNNNKLELLGVIPSKVDKRNPRQVKHLEEINIHYSKYLIPCVIGLRSSVADAIAKCVPVWRIKKTAARKATKEMFDFANYVFNKVDNTK